jgi:phosphoglycerate dehydrogenase-like enzyme
MGTAPLDVFYFSHAGEDVYRLIREAAGAEFRVHTLAANDDGERLERVREADVIICAAYPLRSRFIEAAVRLRLVHHQGVGWQDTIDWPALQARGIPVALTPEGTTVGVAEHTVLMMLAACKRLPFADSELRQGRWHINSLRGVSRELFGKTIGYIGMGRIAQAVAERLAAFGCSGIYHDPVAAPDADTAARLGLRPASLDETISGCDVLTLHVPLTDATRGLIGAERLARMRPGAILVNTARGGIVDDRALAAALHDGPLLAAALDVFQDEPPQAGHPLMALPNVVLTPHISAGTRDAMAQKMAALFDNLRRFRRGEPLRNRVTAW